MPSYWRKDVVGQEEKFEADNIAELALLVAAITNSLEIEYVEDEADGEVEG